MPLQIDTLRYFISVVDSGSIQGAARRLLIAPSALSRQMKLLEAEVSAPLLERLSTGVALTEAGSLVYAWAKQQNSEADALLSQLRKVAQGTDLNVKIACAEGCIGRVMSDLMEPLTLRFPRLEGEVDVLSSEEVATGVLAGQYDFGLMYGRVARLGLKTLGIRAMPLVAAIPVSKKTAESGVASYADLEDMPWILPNRSFQIRQELDHGFAQAGYSPRIMLETNSLSLAIRLSSSHAAGTFTSRALFDMLNPEGLTAVDLPNSNLMAANLSMVVAEGKGAFLSHILKERVLNRIPGWNVQESLSDSTAASVSHNTHPDE